MNRRNALAGLAGIFAAGFAPAAVGSGVLMPTRRLALAPAPTLRRVPNHMAVDVCQVSVSTDSAAISAILFGAMSADVGSGRVGR